MKKTTLFILVIATVATIISCNFSGTSPKTVFETIGLNGNKIPRNFYRAFDEIRGQKNNGTLIIVTPEGETKNVSAEEYVKTYYTKMYDDDIKKVKELSADEETQPIIEAGLEMFLYADEIYKTDYIRIAKMIDEGKSDEEINLEIEKLEATKGVELDKKYNKTMDLLIPYADKHGVEYKTMNTPF